MKREPTFRELLHWAQKAYRLETPDLEFSQSRLDAGGAPQMHMAVQSYLGLAPRLEDGREIADSRPDDGSRLASRKDRETGQYMTPLRAALSRIGGERARFLRDLASDVLFPAHVAERHGIPAWAAQDVAHRSLLLLRSQYHDAPYHDERGWISGRSDSQRAAESVGAI